VLAAGDRARSLAKHPAWIRGIDHRIEPHALGARDLTKSVSTALAGKKAGALDGTPDAAELHAQYSHEEVLLRQALSLGASVSVNPSGGPLASNPTMVTGLARFGEAAKLVLDGSAKRVVAHASSGPCLQQNLVSVLGSDK